MTVNTKTPWQKVYSRFGVSQADLANLLECHRSKISRALSDPHGLINGRDQRRIIAAARHSGISITPADLTPEVAA